MHIHTKAIVLRKMPYTDGSAVITAYTRQLGAVAFIAKGLSRKRSLVSKGAIQPLSRVVLEATFRENRQLQQLKSLTHQSDSALPLEDPQKVAMAMFMAEVLYRSLREESADEDLFDFLDEAVNYFATSLPNPDLHLLILMRLTKYFGFFPSGSFSNHNPAFLISEGIFGPLPSDARPVLLGDDAKWFDILARTPIGETIKDENLQAISRVARRVLLGNLIQYYASHLEGMGKVKSLEVLMEVFN